MSQRSGQFALTFGTEAGTTGGNPAPKTLAITDTNPHYSDWFNGSQNGRVVAQLKNTLNKSVTCTLQGTEGDKSVITDLPNPLTLTDGSSTAQNGAIALTDPWGLIRLKFVAALAPGSGVVSGYFDWREIVG